MNYYRNPRTGEILAHDETTGDIFALLPLNGMGGAANAEIAPAAEDTDEDEDMPQHRTHAKKKVARTPVKKEAQQDAMTARIEKWLGKGKGPDWVAMKTGADITVVMSVKRRLGKSAAPAKAGTQKKARALR